MMWENLSLPITFSVPDNMNLQISLIREELKGEKGFQWQNYVSAVNFLVGANENLDEALAWADYAISAPFVGTRNFQTLSAKSAVLTGMGKMDESTSIMDEAIKLPSTTVFDIHNYGRVLLNQNNVERALEVLNYNYERFDGEWPTAVGLMRAYSAKGDFDKAIKYGEISVEQAPDDLNKNYLKGAVEKLKNKEKI
jgi:tetratricopeptide (TPR) repeat protein